MQMTSLLKSKTLLKSSFVFLLLLAACDSDLKQAILDVARIDSEYSVKLSDYENGLTWFDTHVREIPTNQPEYDEMLAKFNTLKQGKTGRSLDYVNFRIELLEAEKLYASGSRRPFASYQVKYFKCSKTNDLLLSISEVRQALNKTEEAMAIYPSIKEDAPIFPYWVENMKKDGENIAKQLEQAEYVALVYCNESTDNSSQSELS